MLQNNTTYKIMPLDFVASDTNNNFKINFKIGFISLQKLIIVGLIIMLCGTLLAVTYQYGIQSMVNMAELGICPQA